MSIDIATENGKIEIRLPTPSSYIYQFLAPNGKKYIGQTKDIPRRISQHITGTGSTLLLKDLVLYGVGEFVISILEILYDSNQAHVDEREDHFIKTLDTLAPIGYNQRYNKSTVDEVPVDLNNIQITAKYTFRNNGFDYFSIPRFTQCRAYQILTNLGKKKNLTHKTHAGYDYYELKTIADSNLVQHKVYKLSLAYKNGFRLIECDGS